MCALIMLYAFISTAHVNLYFDFICIGEQVITHIALLRFKRYLIPSMQRVILVMSYVLTADFMYS